MHIAFLGTHYSGKSSLLEYLPGYEYFDEPYWYLCELGRHFSNPPTIEEFEEQLKYSMNLIELNSSKVLFDSCHIDFLAYALVIAEKNSEEFDKEKWKLQVEQGAVYRPCGIYTY